MRSCVQYAPVFAEAGERERERRERETETERERERETGKRDDREKRERERRGERDGRKNIYSCTLLLFYFSYSWTVAFDVRAMALVRWPSAFDLALLVLGLSPLVVCVSFGVKAGKGAGGRVGALVAVLARGRKEGSARVRAR